MNKFLPTLLLTGLFALDALGIGFDFTGCEDRIAKSYALHRPALDKRPEAAFLPEEGLDEFANRMAHYSVVRLYEMEIQQVATLFIEYLARYQRARAADDTLMPDQTLMPGMVVSSADLSKVGVEFAQELARIMRTLSMFRQKYNKRLTLITVSTGNLSEFTDEDMLEARALAQTEVYQELQPPSSFARFFGAYSEAEAISQCMARAKAMVGHEKIPGILHESLVRHISFLEAFRLEPDYQFKRFLDGLDELIK